MPTDDGAFVVGEPQGSPGWYPVNDNPRDKATYEFRVTVPDRLTVMANGVLLAQTSRGGKTTFVWRESLPMAPYLATTTLGRFDVTQDHLGSGLPVYIAVDPTLWTAPVLKKLPEIVDFYSSIYGPSAQPNVCVGIGAEPRVVVMATGSGFGAAETTNTAVP